MKTTNILVHPYNQQRLTQIAQGIHFTSSLF